MWWMMFVRLPRRWVKPLDRRHKRLSRRLLFSFSFKHGRVIELSFIISGIGSFTSFLCLGRFFQLIKELGENSWGWNVRKKKTVWKVTLKTVWNEEVPLCCLSECKSKHTHRERRLICLCTLWLCQPDEKERPKRPSKFPVSGLIPFLCGFDFPFIVSESEEKTIFVMRRQWRPTPVDAMQSPNLFQELFRTPRFFSLPLTFLIALLGVKKERRGGLSFISLFSRFSQKFPFFYYHYYFHPRSVFFVCFFF